MKKATKDIIVYKGLNGRKILRSPYKTSTVWRRGKIVTESNFEEKTTCLHLNYGFHSCIEASRGLNHADKVYKFVIPKGALYYKNNNEYLSNQIYLKSIVPLTPKQLL